ncbi:J domain-containing protein [Holdemanella biformis]|uniref:J domain-containing protein n=1 Tax=Holdemanella biformis TaxID=1735 RepID=UPI001C38757D|nr:J domain-containing protein [Holdemanella biformis]MBV4131267.1 J domain-containing protein [Holdemanella biformis]MBV4151088.1 J domain-containing protein [Holdemanella biformis]
MNAWEILGIEPTSDKKTIKRAYAKLLKQYHPEENPEKFKQIQAAYQQCLHSDQEIESVSYEQNIESKQDIKTKPISIKEDTIVPPPIPKITTLFIQNEKDVVVYQDILNSIEKSLPKKIGSKDIVQVFTDSKIMPYLEDELFCRRLEDIFLSRKLKYIKNFRDPIYMYLGKYGMSKLSNVMDYSNVPFYKRPAFVAFIVISVILLEVILGIV